MYSIRPLPEFTAWIDDLKDEAVRAVIAARIKRLACGLMGDVAPVGEGISELRLHFGSGWRLYFVQRGAQSSFCLQAARSAPKQETSSERKPWRMYWIEGEDHEQTHQHRRFA